MDGRFCFTTDQSNLDGWVSHHLWISPILVFLVQKLWWRWEIQGRTFQRLQDEAMLTRNPNNSLRFCRMFFANIEKHSTIVCRNYFPSLKAELLVVSILNHSQRYGQAPDAPRNDKELKTRSRSNWEMPGTSFPWTGSGTGRLCIFAFTSFVWRLPNSDCAHHIVSKSLSVTTCATLFELAG